MSKLTWLGLTWLSEGCKTKHWLVSYGLLLEDSEAASGQMTSIRGEEDDEIRHAYDVDVLQVI